MATTLLDELRSDYTISRIGGEMGLVEAGLNDRDRFEKMRKEHKMTLYYKFLNPENAKKFDRPVVDVSMPRNLLDERDQIRSDNGVFNKGAYFSLNPGHIGGVQEPSPYVHTHHNSDFMIYGYIGSTTLFLNWYVSRTQLGGSILGHPHTQWAHNIVFGAGIIRAFLATTIGLGGALYTYEYLYTHAPYFKIRDPSTNGWTRPWEEGQSTFAARALSMAFFPLGASFFTGTFKRFHFNYAVSLVMGMGYELARYSASSYRFNLHDKMTKENDKQGAAGSLGVEMRKNTDYTTGIMKHELNIKYANANQSTLRELGWVDSCFDNMPLTSAFRKERNHRFNWTYVQNSMGDRAYRYKNESWELPELQLNARNHTAHYDKQQTPSRIQREVNELNLAAAQ